MCSYEKWFSQHLHPIPQLERPLCEILTIRLIRFSIAIRCNEVRSHGLGMKDVRCGSFVSLYRRTVWYISDVLGSLSCDNCFDMMSPTSVAYRISSFLRSRALGTCRFNLGMAASNTSTSFSLGKCYRCDRPTKRIFQCPFCPRNQLEARYAACDACFSYGWVICGCGYSARPGDLVLDSDFHPGTM